MGDWLLGMAFRIVMLMYSGKSLKCPTFWPLSNLPYFCKKSNILYFCHRQFLVWRSNAMHCEWRSTNSTTLQTLDRHPKPTNIASTQYHQCKRVNA